MEEEPIHVTSEVRAMLLGVARRTKRLSLTAIFLFSLCLPRWHGMKTNLTCIAAKIQSLRQAESLFRFLI